MKHTQKLLNETKKLINKYKIKIKLHRVHRHVLNLNTYHMYLEFKLKFELNSTLCIKNK